ncbi:ABC transporter permease subunit, partial [Pseudomonas syringae group genomosp. 7]|uniref:ABC transporter permease subunit n=1 Tax=Pseudomonas syringae group genomosp. 7 TaxID=251699 RepID=UPI00376F7EAB
RASTYSAYFAEFNRSAIHNVPQGQREAARALDFRRGDTWLRIILRHALKPILPVGCNYLIGMFNERPLLAVITIPDLFQACNEMSGMTYRYNEPYT